MNPIMKHIRCVMPEICGMMNPANSMTIMYIVLGLVGTNASFMPSMENMTPDMPTTGTGDGMMKDAATVMRYIGMRLFVWNCFLLRQNQRAYMLQKRCVILPWNN